MVFTAALEHLYVALVELGTRVLGHVQYTVQGLVPAVELPSDLGGADAVVSGARVLQGCAGELAS